VPRHIVAFVSDREPILNAWRAIPRREEEAMPTAPQSMSSVLRQGFPALLALVVAPVVIYVMTLPGGQELAPGNTKSENWAFAIALGVGALCFGMMISAKPRSSKTLISALFWSLFYFALCWPVAMTAIDRVREHAHFSNMPVVLRERYLPVGMASIHHGRGGIGYDVWLTHYPVLLTIDPQDYRSAFGDAERASADGYCVHVMIETTGKASRILANPGEELPEGSLVRCPPQRRNSRSTPRDRYGRLQPILGVPSTTEPSDRLRPFGRPTASDCEPVPAQPACLNSPTTIAPRL
jgi:hypothetical protein